MNEADALTTLAELFIALTTATGIILALTRDPSRWRPFDSVRVFWLLALSLGGAVLALFPLGLHMAGLPDATVWRTSSGLFAALFALFWAIAVRQAAMLPPEERNFRLYIAVPVQVANLATLASELLNALGVVFHGSPSVYFFGLLWALIWAALVFVLLIFLRPASAA